jgi:GxxExxY protein
LGPGLLEGTYCTCLFREFVIEGLSVEREVSVPVEYKQAHVKRAYRVDFILNGELLVEVKSVSRLELIHTAQVLTYMRLLDFREGLLLNFNVLRLKDGLKRLLR